MHLVYNSETKETKCETTNLPAKEKLMVYAFDDETEKAEYALLSHTEQLMELGCVEEPSNPEDERLRDRIHRYRLEVMGDYIVLLDRHYLSWK